LWLVVDRGEGDAAAGGEVGERFEQRGQGVVIGRNLELKLLAAVQDH